MPHFGLHFRATAVTFLADHEVKPTFISPVYLYIRAHAIYKV